METSRKIKQENEGWKKYRKEEKKGRKRNEVNR